MAEKVEVDKIPEERLEDRIKVVVIGQYAFYPVDGLEYRYDIAKLVSEIFKTAKNIVFCGELGEGGTLTVRFGGDNFPYAFRKKMKLLFEKVDKIVSVGIDKENKMTHAPYHIEMFTSDECRIGDAMYEPRGTLPVRRNPYFCIDWYETFGREGPEAEWP